MIFKIPMFNGGSIKKGRDVCIYFFFFFYKINIITVNSVRNHNQSCYIFQKTQWNVNHNIFLSSGGINRRCHNNCLEIIGRPLEHNL